MELLRYVHLNPVRIGVGKGEAIPGERKPELEDWKWSSHGAYAGRVKGPPWLASEWLSYFGGNPREARRRYRRFVGDAFARGIARPFDSVHGSLVLGGEALREKVRGLLGDRDREEERRWVHEDADREAMRQWAERSAEGEEDVGLKAWLLVTLGRSKRVDVAKGLGYRDGSAVTHLLKQLEAARREDRSLNRRMKKLTDAFDSRFKR